MKSSGPRKLENKRAAFQNSCRQRVNQFYMRTTFVACAKTKSDCFVYVFEYALPTHSK